MTPFFGELIGTALLMLLGNGSVANVVLKHTKGYASGLKELARLFSSLPCCKLRSRRWG